MRYYVSLENQYSASERHYTAAGGEVQVQYHGVAFTSDGIRIRRLIHAGPALADAGPNARPEREAQCKT